MQTARQWHRGDVKSGNSLLNSEREIRGAVKSSERRARRRASGD